MNTHRGSSYFNPHPKSRLAYFAEAVCIWCDFEHEQPKMLDDELSVRCVKKSILERAIQKFGSDNPAIPDLVAAEYEAVVGYCRSKALAMALVRLTLPGPGKNNRRADTPPHRPLRPHTKIIAVMMASFAVRSPGQTTNALRNRCAEFLNEGIPRSDASGRLTNRSIRSAEDAYFALGKDRAVEYPRVLKRIDTWGAPNFWDRNVIEQTLWAVSESKGDPALNGNLFELDARWTFNLLRAFERIYNVARSEPRFKGLEGADLARAIDAACCFGRLVESCQEQNTLAETQAKIRTGFANAAA